MPSGSYQEGDTVFIRATVVSPGSDCFQVLIDDGVRLSLTVWVPARECAKPEDIGTLPPPTKANPWHLER